MVGHDRVTPDGRRFFAQIEELKKLQVRVGIQAGTAQTDEGVDVLDIAVFNEVGTSNIPARPFMRESADSNKSAIEKVCKAQLQKITQGKTAEQALNEIGTMQVGFIQDKITKSKEWAEPNAESTIRQKTKNGNVGDTPLVDTGRMLQSVHYVITPKGGGDGWQWVFFTALIR